MCVQLKFANMNGAQLSGAQLIKADIQQAERQKAQVTSEKEAAIMNLARNDDLDVATIARQAKKDVQSNDGEVVISLH